jgi:hypothetical protein
MPSKLRKALIACVPLAAVQGFLIALNLVNSDGDITWAIYPVLAMMIPQTIILGTTLLSLGDGQHAAVQHAVAARCSVERAHRTYA